MALTDDNMTMLVQPSGNYGNNCGFGNDGWWIILLLLACGNGGWGFGGFGGGYGMMNGALGYDFPWILNGQQNTNNNVSNGFRDSMLNDGITSIRDGISGLSTQMCGGFGDVQNSLCNGFNSVNMSINGAQNALAQQMYGNEIASLERSFAAQTASTQGMNAIQAQLAQCCCDNRAATADVKYTIATEACANRATSTANTQAILDKLCQLELDNAKAQIDAKNDTIAQLRNELLYARGQASQDVQTARILAGQTAEVDALYNRLNNCPVSTVPVYGKQPIFTCGGNTCGCGM